jgi:hypothetical protein
MPHPKLQIHKDYRGRYEVNIPKSLSSDRPRRRRRRFFSTHDEAEAFVRSFKSQLRDLGTSFRILMSSDSYFSPSGDSYNSPLWGVIVPYFSVVVKSGGKACS